MPTADAPILAAVVGISKKNHVVYYKVTLCGHLLRFC